MRALVYTAPRQVVLVDCPRPRLAAGEIAIAVSAAGICGADLAGFLGRSRQRVPPLVLGHELVGHTPDGRRVVANPLGYCGRCTACLGGTQNLCAGLSLLGMGRVAGCFAEFVAVPEERVYEIPDVVSDARAVFAEPVANMVHLFRIAAPPHFCRLGIVGAGTMGSLALLMARRLGIREILVEDVDEVRLEAARQMGATLAVNPSTEDGRADARRFAGHGLDMVLDASGAADARQTAFELCRPGGEVVLLGMADVRSELDFGTSIRKELRVTMSFGYTPVDFERSLRLLEDGEIDLTPWTAEMPLEDGQKAFDRMADSRDDTLKMILRVR